MFPILFDESLHSIRVIVDAVCGEGETIGIKPMMVEAEHFRLDIVANPVYEFNLQEGLASDKIPNDGFFGKVSLTLQDIVNGLLGDGPLHTLLDILTDKIAILAGKLAILSDDEGDALRHARLPT